MHWAELFTSGASLFIVATATTKTMVPLRALTIAANIFFALVFAVLHLWLPMALQILALPLNSYRLYQMLDLIKNVRRAVGGDTSMEWLKPFMTRRSFKTGDILFAKGEPADRMFCTVTGRYRLRELGIELKPGEVVGELAMLAPDNRRTATLECIESGQALSITYEQVEQLYYQNPTFGFYFLRLATARLFDNISRLETEVARLKAATAPA
jgi:CRP/FNR family transcriptional regulator, cyclic AMP receptor protein